MNPKKSFLFKIVRWWLPIAVVVTVLSGTFYLAVQQDMRMGANDPQIQLAEDAAATLQADIPADSILPSEQTDISQSLDPFIIIFDQNGKVIASSAVLQDTSPVPPLGVFFYAAAHGENRLTWQPEPGVRSAIVVVPYRSSNQSGFVLAGRSLREVEKRESRLTEEVFAGWAASLAFSLLLIFCLVWCQKPEQEDATKRK